MIQNEIKHYSKLLDQQTPSPEIQKIEPKVSAFRHAYQTYATYLKEHIQNVNFEKYIIDHTQSSSIHLLSIGAGTADWEIKLIESVPNKIKCDVIDINPKLLEKAKNYSLKKNLDLHIRIEDANNIKLDENTYDFVIARSSLHHLVELEHVFAEINKSLKSTGSLIVIGEVIGRNGLKLYPETETIAQGIFTTLPEKFRFNNYTKTIDKKIPNIDHSVESFEAIRSEDILPLLLKIFKPKEYFAFDAFLSLLLDFRYGPNYDLTNQLDKTIVEFITHLDAYYIENKILNPTCLFGIFEKNH